MITDISVPVGEVHVPMCALLDRVMRERMAEIIKARGLTTVVETGVDRGGSTLLFSLMADRVIGIDNDPGKIAITADRITFDPARR